MKKLTTPFLLLVLSMILTSCFATSEEKEQRRLNAFDISGTYSVKTSSYTPMTLTIVNESDVSNVYAVISRGDFTNEEKSAFLRQGISLNEVEKFRTTFYFGQGRHFSWLVGGENISTDIGKSSTVFISTSSGEGLNTPDYDISYSVSASMHKSDMVLRGKITMTIQAMEVVNGQKTYVTKETVDMKF